MSDPFDPKSSNPFASLSVAPVSRRRSSPGDDLVSKLSVEGQRELAERLAQITGATDAVRGDPVTDKPAGESVDRTRKTSRSRSPSAAPKRKRSASPAKNQAAAQEVTSEEAPAEIAQTVDKKAVAWAFYADETRASGQWRDDIKPGQVLFWQHGLDVYPKGGGPSYSKMFQIGDRVLVVVAGEIVATAVLAADGAMKFADEANVRWWPIQIMDVFDPVFPTISFDDVLRRQLIPYAGSVQAIQAKEFSRLFRALETHVREPLGLPLIRSVAIARLARGAALRQAVLAWPELQVDPLTRQRLGLVNDPLPQVFNDRHDAKDLLGIDPEVTAFAQLAISRKIRPPLSVGMFGNWGAGKSFFMEKVRAKIDLLAGRARDASDPSHKHLHHEVPQIRFNAWHYIETNLWASLVEFIFAELDRWLRQNDYSAKDVDALFDRLATSRRLKLEAFAQLLTAQKDAEAARKALEEAKTAYRDVVAVPLTANEAWSAAAKTFVGQVQGEDREKLQAVAASLGIVDFAASSEATAGVVRDAGDQAMRGRIILEDIVAKAGSVRGAALIVAALIGPLGALLILRLFLPANAGQSIQEALLAGAASLASLTLLGQKALTAARGQLDVLDRLRVNLNQVVAERTQTESDRLQASQADAAAAAQKVIEAERRALEASDRVTALLHEQSELSASGRLNRFIRDKATNGDYARHLGIIASIHKDFGQLSALLEEGEGEVDPATSDKMAEMQKAHRAAAQALVDEARKSGTPLTSEQEADLLETHLEQHQTPNIGRIVLYIDDLDRCPPEKVVDVLQAIHMLLYFPLFVVFVAVDARWLKRSIGNQFSDLIEVDKLNVGPAEARDGERLANAQDYLEKIFQIPFSVTAMDGAASATFVEQLTGPLLRKVPVQKKDQETDESGEKAQDTGGALFDPFDDMTPGALAAAFWPDLDGATGAVLADIDLTQEEQLALTRFGAVLGGSPRRTKRFVNTYMLIKIALRKKPDRPDPEASPWCLAALLAVVVGFRECASAFFEQLESAKTPPASMKEFLKGLDEISTRAEAPYRLALQPILGVMDAHSQSYQGEVLKALAPIVARYAF